MTQDQGSGAEQGTGLPPIPNVQPAAAPAAPAASAAASPPIDPTTGQPSPDGTHGSAGAAQGELPLEPAGEEAARAARGAQARIDALTSEKWAERRRAAEAEQRLQEAERRLAELEGQPGGTPLPPVDPADPAAGRVYTAAEVQAHARALAQQEARQIAFNNEVNAAIAQGQRAHEDFDASIKSLQRFGPLPPHFVAAVLEAGQGDVGAHEIIYALGKDLTETDRLLSLPPERQGAAIVRYALTKVAKTDPAAPAPAGPAPANPLAAAAPALSSAPPPVRSALSPASSPQARIDDPNLPIQEWMKLRDQQVAARGAR